MRARPENDCPPAGGAAEGRSTAVGANAGATYDRQSEARQANPRADDAADLPNGFTSEPVWELPKRDGLLRAGEREYRGARFFELRLWARGGATPTREGVTLPCEAVPGLARALTAYVAATSRPQP